MAQAITSDANLSSQPQDDLPGYSVEPPVNVPRELPPDLSERLVNLKLDPLTGNGVNVSPDHCIAHLKFLEALYQLKETVGNTKDLFGILDPIESSETPATPGNDQNALAEIRVREKRWAVYVARAAHRFEQWWGKCVFATRETKLTTKELTTEKGIEKAAYQGEPIKTLQSTDRLPPLDVLMVWHSYLLNPRCFFEDCFRYQKLDFFATPFPLAAIDRCIDLVTFEFKPTEQAVANFISKTGLNWDNLEDPSTLAVMCGACKKSSEVPWTFDSQWSASSKEMTRGSGFADASFMTTCENCKTPLDHDHLRVVKFLNDMDLLVMSDVPMPGTLLTPDGVPEAPTGTSFNLGKPYNNFPNTLIKAGLQKDLQSKIMKSPKWNVEDIRHAIEEALKDQGLIRSTMGYRTRVLMQERNAIRKMMSRYWYNSSPFALDLTGAVIRQGSFINKMHDIDWLHSPALKGTMGRLLEKYKRFFQIMASNPKNMAVPTLDVDLGWHTHQLNSSEYYRFSVEYARRFIDHDDKVEETKLSESFAWTSKKYSELYGEPYSECRCWYCEAVREANSSKLDSLFKPKKKEATARLHEVNNETDPLKSAHISAHNAVRDIDGEAKASVHAAKLDKAYQKACAKARKKGQKEPARDDYYAAYYWGYPVYFPIYYPYAAPVGFGTGDCYPGAPYAYSSSAGAYGNCAAGTCGGMAAAGGSCGAAGCGGTGGCGGVSGGGCGSSGCGGGCGGS
ncbi:uncharacterized protein PV09_02498 [Verruconis gallopava]|uniref:Alpha-ketoglutarate-dependent sulfonate dioxygenase n=1 Tax=Verruconis gallopava TaxID=253628 RepID=A0A0D2AIT3_9PEZI|nr:uncharacterized protein PV09_02498 [Verruconis gallopava]KIW06818.1 hypothetical protein PV09_02498 [Verruconis gallopava]